MPGRVHPRPLGQRSHQAARTAGLHLASLDHDPGDYAKDGGDGFKLVLWMAEHDRWPSQGIRIHSANPPWMARMLVDIDHYGPYPPGNMLRLAERGRLLAGSANRRRGSGRTLRVARRTLYGDNRWVSGVVALVMFLALPGMFLGWFVGQWIGDARWPWWSAVVAAIALTVIAARLTVLQSRGTPEIHPRSVTRSSDSSSLPDSGGTS